MSKERKEHIKTGKEGVVFAIIQNGNILLEERLNPKSPYYKKTIIPGGGVEKGESFWQTLIREIKEECGCEPVFSDYLATRNQKEGNVIYHRHLIAVTKIKGSVQNMEPKKGRHVWANIKKAREICEHQSTQEFLDDLEGFIHDVGLRMD